MSECKARQAGEQAKKPGRTTKAGVRKTKRAPVVTQGPASPDWEMARCFLERIYPEDVPADCEADFLFMQGGRTDRDRGHGTSIDEILEWLPAYPQHTMLAISPCLYARAQGKGRLGGRPIRKNSKAESLACGWGCFVDLDPPKGKPLTPAQIKAAVRILRAFEWPPTLIVATGGGLHAYWIFDSPIALRTGAERAVYSGIREALRQRLDELGGPWAKADAGAKAITQPGRIPGTWNKKPEYDRAVVAWIVCEDGPLYTHADLPDPVPVALDSSSGRFVRGVAAEPDSWEFEDEDERFGVVLGPGLDTPVPQPLEDVHAAVFPRDARVKAAWEGTVTYSHRTDPSDQSYIDFKYGEAIAVEVFVRVGGDPAAWMKVMVDAIGRRRSNDDRDQKPEKRTDPRYLGKYIALPIWMKKIAPKERPLRAALERNAKIERDRVELAELADTPARKMRTKKKLRPSSAAGGERCRTRRR